MKSNDHISLSDCRHNSKVTISSQFVVRRLVTQVCNFILFLGVWVRMWIFYASLGLVSSFQAENSESKFGYGVHFKYIGNFEVVTDKHLHIFDLKLPTLDRFEENPVMQCQMSNESLFKSCADSLPYYIAINRLQQTAYVQIKQNIRQIHSVLRYKKTENSPKKYKRGLLDFVGNIGYFLFGLARKSDIEALQDRIQLIDHRNNRILQEFESQISKLVSATSILNDRVNLIQDQLSQQTLWLNQLSKQFQYKWLNAIQFSLFLTESLLNFTKISDNIQHLRLAAEELVMGRLHPALLSKSDIKQALRNIMQEIKLSHSMARVLVNDASFFYKRSYFMAVKVQTLLFITISVPITTLPSSFDLYEVITYPKSIDEALDSSTLIESLPKYFAIARDLSLYATWEVLPSLELGDFSYLLDTAKITLQSDLNSCIMAVFTGDSVNVEKLCEFKLLSGKPSVMIQISSQKIIVENILNFSLACQGSPVQFIPGCRSCVLTIASTCTLNSHKNFIPSTIPQIHNTSSTASLTKAYSVNQIILQNFFNPEQWTKFQSNYLSDKSWNLQLPEFRMADKMENQYNSLQEDFKTTIAAIKDNQILFQNSYGALVSKTEVPLQNTDFSYITVYLIAVLYALIIILIIIIIYLYFKVHKIMLLVLTLTTKIKSVDAIKNWIIPHTSNAPVVCHCSSTVHLYLMIAILVIIILALVGYFIWRCIRKHSSDVDSYTEDQLILRFSNPQTHFDISWWSLPRPFGDGQLIARDNINQVTLHNHFCSSMLSFSWKIEMHFAVNNLTIMPECEVPITFFQARKLSHIIGRNKHYTVDLMLVQKNVRHCLKIEPMPRQSSVSEECVILQRST